MENVVRIIKCSMKKAEVSDSDLYFSVLNYRMEPVKHGLSLAGFSFNRKLKTRVLALLGADVRVSEDELMYK